ncbi:kinesin-like protein costa [Haematobia irritans]|uniref:kinesin-like protein costa n=1 Tax=Haematobia irritans TaxID=7368 RepID=UPI003F4F6CCC
MEIPIQVAVRICSKRLQEEEEEKLEEGIENIECSNGNLQDLRNDSGDREAKKDRKYCVRSIPFTGGLPGLPPPGCIDPPDVVQVGPHSFPVTHALPVDCSQGQIYYQTVIPLMSLFMEGFDASVVAYGQKSCGKTYTLYGNGFNDPSEEDNQGLVARCVAEIFQHINKHPERTYVVNITWTEICREIIRDVFGVGSVQCMTKKDAFHWLQVGYKLLNSTKKQMGHSLFSITLEQRWITKEGLIQHRLSTASFTDLGATERICMQNALGQPSYLPKDLGLQSLECVVSTLIDPALMVQGYENVPYHHTMLTTMLKDSFGGRAQTLVIVCVSPWEEDLNETVANMQFAFKVQCVHNFVVINSFTDDNTLATEEEEEDVGSERMDEDEEEMKMEPESETLKKQDQFALQFSAHQWSKLVANAEDLLSKLISSSGIGEEEKLKIESWLIQKQECDDCLNTSDSTQDENSVGVMQDGQEPTEDSDPDVSDPETSLPRNSENGSDLEMQETTLQEKFEKLWQDFEKKTDEVIQKAYQDFMTSHPKAITQSQESSHGPCEKSTDERKPSLGPNRGRRCSIQPGSALSSVEMAMLQQLATREQFDKKEYPINLQQEQDFLNPKDEERGEKNSALQGVKKKLRKLNATIEGRLKQIKEIQETIQVKENIIAELIKNSETRSTAKQKFQKKKAKIQAEYERSKKTLDKALAQRKDKHEVKHLKGNVAQLEQRLNDITSIKHIAGDSEQKIKKLQQSLTESKTLLENLQKKVEKETIKKESLENEIKTIDAKEDMTAKAQIHNQRLPNETAQETSCKSDEIQTRINHLDHVLNEKKNNLQAHGSEDNEGLRHEIRNLRKTRDHLLDQRCSLDRKFKLEKSLSLKEERKLLECDEAIEAIDAAIEFKNEMICGHKSIDTSERLQREKGEQMLMARLNKLNNEEMRTLLYKYFTKVIDLKDSSRKLEIQLQQLEREKDAWEWNERVLSNAVRQAYLEGERKAVLLQRQHEMKLNLMLRHLAEESSTSSASFSDQSQSSISSFYKPNQLALVPTTMSMSSSCYSDSDYEWPHQLRERTVNPPKLYEKNMLIEPNRPLKSYGPPPLENIKGKTLKIAPNILNAAYMEQNFKSKFSKPSKTNDMELCQLHTQPLVKYSKSDDKIKEKETKNKLFAKFQVLTRYASSPKQDDSLTSSSNSSSKSKDKDSSTLTQDDVQKCSNGKSQKTKVTRQKNKLIIQDKSRSQ